MNAIPIETRETREQWLESAAESLKHDLFAPKRLTLPVVRISVGFTSSRTSKAIGAHWAPQAASDGIGQIYITPTSDDSLSILATLVHELVHAAVGNEAGHGKAFKRAALAVGLEGKMKATTAGPELANRLNEIVDALGPIPHAALNPAMRPTTKQTTRLLKASCEQGYIVRLSQKQADVGMPSCPCCNTEMTLEGSES